MESETNREIREVLEMFKVDTEQKEGVLTIIGHLKGVAERHFHREMIDKVKATLDRVFYLRKEELNKIDHHDKTRAFAVAGEDLIFNYKNDVLDILKKNV